MKQVALRTALVAVVAIAAFALGRSWPRSASTTTAGSAHAVREETQAASPPTSRAGRVGPMPARATAPETGLAFDHVVARDFEGAATLRSAVVVAVSERRRRRNPVLRACLDGGELGEDALLRFSVEVHAADGRVEIGPAVIVDVLEGPPLGDETLACLLAALDERETIEIDASVAYDGTIEVPIRFVAVGTP